MKQLATFDVCVLACVGIGLLGGGLPGFIASVIYLAGCAAYYAIKIAACVADLNTALAAARAHLRLDLEACGVNMVVTE